MVPYKHFDTENCGIADTKAAHIHTHVYSIFRYIAIDTLQGPGAKYIYIECI